MNSLLAPFTVWLHTLPPWSQPAVVTFIPCVIMLTLLTVSHRIRLHRRGEKFTRHKTKPAEMVGGLLFSGMLFYLRERYPIISLVLHWPDRTFPYYHQHGGLMWLGFTAAALIANWVALLFAALFLRGHQSSRKGSAVSTSGFNMLPDPPEGFGWYRQPTTQERITRTRTYQIEEE